MVQKNFENNFISLFTKKGKKGKTVKVYNNLLFNIKRKTKASPSKTIDLAINNLLPKVTLKKLNKRKSTIQLINQKQQIKKSLRWLYAKNPNILLDNFLQVKDKTGLAYKNKKQFYSELEKYKYTV